MTTDVEQRRGMAGIVLVVFVAGVLIGAGGMAGWSKRGEPPEAKAAVVPAGARGRDFSVYGSECEEAG